MTEMKPGLFDRMLQQSALRRFRRWAETARDMDLRDLRKNRAAALAALAIGSFAQ